MNEIKNLKNLFFHEIQVLWSAETQLLTAIPNMIAHANHPALKQCLAAHLAETETHQAAMGLIAKQLGIPPDGDFNPGMKGIIEEGNMVMSKQVTPEGLDATLIAGAQKVEHYEISGYGSAAQYAELLGYKDIAAKLQAILFEEKEADYKLNALAKHIINERAR